MDLFMTDITVSLPDELAQQAQTAGLLRPDAIAPLLRDAMNKRQLERRQPACRITGGRSRAKLRSRSCSSKRPLRPADADSRC